LVLSSTIHKNHEHTHLCDSALGCYFAHLLITRLDEFGVEYIELTSPAASPESRAHCEAICNLGLKNTKILTHIRCHMDDARIAVETGVDGVDVVIGTSSFLREHSHGKDMTWITKT